MRSTIATIDLDALEWNLSVIRRQAPEKSILGMVKANAYGHGMIAIARALQHCGVDVLGTAFVDEALQLKGAGITIPIMVLTPIEEHDCVAVIENDLVTVACDVQQVTNLAMTAIAAGKIAEVHLYVDTGMLREGFRPHDAVEAATVIAAMPGIRLTGICTHFATSDEPHSAFFREQLSTFVSVLSNCAAVGSTFASVHAANSAAMWQSDSTHFTMVRPGLSLYGYVSPGSKEMSLRPVMSLSSRVISVRRAWPGESVSYGRRYVVPEESTIVTVPIGYGDGYLRSLTGAACCLIGGIRYPIVGTICMDELMVNVGNADVKQGDEVVLMGQQTANDGHTASIDANDIAQWASTIPYDVTTSVSARVPRCFTGRLAAMAGIQTQLKKN